MADVATYFEERGELEKAVQLYQRAGDISRALDLCFRAAAAQVPSIHRRGGGRSVLFIGVVAFSFRCMSIILNKKLMSSFLFIRTLDVI